MHYCRKFSKEKLTDMFDEFHVVATDSRYPSGVDNG